MTKDEIKKALKCCSNPSISYCKDCPYANCGKFDCCNGKMCKDALNLITEQEKEIKQLEQQNAILCDAWQKVSDENESLVMENSSNLRYNSALRKENKKLKAEIDRLKADDEEKCLKCIESKRTTAEEYAKLQEQFAQYQMASDKEIRAQKKEAEKRFESNMKAVLEIEKKQAQIDVLKELKTRHDYAIKNMGYPWDISQQIDELIKEVQNEN